MEINVTFLVQIFIFIVYIYFCQKYIWPYINKIIKKRKKDILLEYRKIKNIKKKILILKNKFKNIIRKNKEIASIIISEAKKKGELIVNKSKIKALNKYNRILYKLKIKINKEKNIIYKQFYKRISFLLKKILIKITKNTFNKNLDNNFIKKILNNIKIN